MKEGGGGREEREREAREGSSLGRQGRERGEEREAVEIQIQKQGVEK